MPVASNPRYLVMGKRCETLVWSKSLSCTTFIFSQPKHNQIKPQSWNSNQNTHRDLLLRDNADRILPSHTDWSDPRRLHGLKCILYSSSTKNTHTHTKVNLVVLDSSETLEKSIQSHCIKNPRKSPKTKKIFYFCEHPRSKIPRRSSNLNRFSDLWTVDRQWEHWEECLPTW